MMTRADDRAFRTRMLGTIDNLNTSRAISQLLARDDIVARMSEAWPETRKAILAEAEECKRRLDPDHGRRSRDERRRDVWERRRATKSPEQVAAERLQQYQRPGHEWDDDIPF